MNNNDDVNAFFATEDNDEVNFVNHNPTDYESFHAFNDDINKVYEKVEKENSRRDRAKFLEAWDNSMPDRWRGASLARIKNPAAAAALDLIKQGKGNFFITGSSGAGKTYLAYAIIRRYIGVGWVTPSRVKIISEETILSYATSGFEGKYKFDKLFDKRYTLFLIDNVGMKAQYDTRRELPMFEQLLDYIYNNSLFVIFTSNNSAASFSNVLTESGASKFTHLIAGRTIEIKGTRTPSLNDWTENERKEMDALRTERELLDEFDG